MGRLEKALLTFISIFFLSLSGCVSAETLPASTQQTTFLTTTVFTPYSPSSTRVPTKTIQLTPSPTSSPTSIPTLTPASSCLTNIHGSKLYILHDSVLYHGRIQGENLDRALKENHPNWTTFTQIPYWDEKPLSAGEIIDAASFAEEFQINPAITLVSLGVELDWKLPSNGDLFTIARETAKNLDGHYWDYAFDDIDEHTQIKDSYPEIENAGTYAIYAYFEYDKEKLEVWCETYMDLFNHSPLNPP